MAKYAHTPIAGTCDIVWLIIFEHSRDRCPRILA
jgi:hypothetical protein